MCCYEINWTRNQMWFLTKLNCQSQSLLFSFFKDFCLVVLLQMNNYDHKDCLFILEQMLGDSEFNRTLFYRALMYVLFPHFFKWFFLEERDRLAVYQTRCLISNDAKRRRNWIFKCSTLSTMYIGYSLTLIIVKWKYTLPDILFIKIKDLVHS